MNKYMVIIIIIQMGIMMSIMMGVKGHTEEIHEHVHTHNCEHDDHFVKSRPTSEQAYENHPFETKKKRGIQSTGTFRPIRINVSTTALDQDLQGSTAELNFIKTEITPFVLEKLSKMLKVIPVEGNLKLKRYCLSKWGNGQCAYFNQPLKCGQNTVPEEHLAEQQLCSQENNCQTLPGGQGLAETDMVLYFSAKDYGGCANPQSGTLAFAASCARDQYDRPVAGFVNFCAATIDVNEKESMKFTVLHEIVHAMGFSKNEFAFYRDDNGNPRTPRQGINNEPPHNGLNYVAATNTLITQTIRGHEVTKVVLPTVVEKAKEHYDCATLDGVELEDGGGSGTKGSHWEQRIVRGDFMNGQIPHHPIISIFTLAALADSGWYKVDFVQAERLTWGHKKGCGFVSDYCIVNQGTTYPKHYCTTNNEIKCTQNHYAKGLCRVVSYSSALPSYYQYFSSPLQGGPNSLEDYCPVYTQFSYTSGKTSDCRLATNAISTTRKEVWSSDSRCIENTLSTFSSPGSLSGACYPIDCTAAPASIRITINNQQITCLSTEVGSTKSVPGMQGTMICPSIDNICPPQTTNLCENLQCGAHGTCFNNTCICDTNWSSSEFDHCDVTTCNGVSSQSAAVCSSHGTCSDFNKCDCQSGYAGNNCQDHTCNGLAANATQVCSGHGSCTGPNNCSCDDGYFGTNCDNYKCFGFEYAESTVCSGYGSCVGPNNCSCSAGYLGTKCQCEGVGCVCVDNATAIVNSTYDANTTFCNCTGGFSNAPYCDVPVCYGKTKNASCNGEFHGYCRSPNNCSCTIAYKGDQCEIPSKCEEFNFCGTFGECEKGVCSCQSGYTGDSCQYIECYGVSTQSSSVCSGHGQCNSPNNCTCQAGYTGSNCQFPICFDILSADRDVCSGHGDCIAPNNCTCHNATLYSGEDCGDPVCFGVAAKDPNVCYGHGSCIFLDTCDCNTIEETKASGAAEDYAGFGKTYLGRDCRQYECLNQCYDVCDPNTGACPPNTQSTTEIRNNGTTSDAGSLPPPSRISIVALLLSIVFCFFN